MIDLLTGLAAAITAVVGISLLRRRPTRCPWCRRPLVFESRTPYSRLRVFSCGSTHKDPGGPRRSNECRRTE